MAARAAGKFSGPALHDARAARGGRLLRWLRPGSLGIFLLILMLAAAGGWKVWRLRLAADEKAFYARAEFEVLYNQVRWDRITFSQPPDAASLRHLARFPRTFRVYFDWSGWSDPSAPLVLRGRRLPNVVGIAFRPGMDADPWLKELSRADSGLTALTMLNLDTTGASDAGLKELSRPDSGLKTLTWLFVNGTPVTDAGVTALARPDSGLKALTLLDLSSTPVTDAGVRELARPDSGLKALTELNLVSTRVTDAGVAALQKARPGLKIQH